MTVELTVPKGSFAVDEHVELKLTVRNDSDRPVEGIEAGYQIDVWVERAEEPIWLWSLEEGGTTQFSRPHTFAPGEQEEYVVVWKQNYCRGRAGAPGPGNYRAFGVRRGPEEWWRAEPVDFAIE
jgi:hypothetical protein